MFVGELLLYLTCYIMSMLDKPKTLKGVLKIVMENRNSLRDIYEQDTLSLGRILKAIQHTDDLVISELLRTEKINQSAVYKDLIKVVHDKLYQLETLIIETQGGLQIPASIATEREVF